MKGGNNMKASELRIGNFVATEGIDYVEISKIDADFGICYKIPQEFGQFYPYKEVEPIPLTEEWMMRFGFEKIPYAQILFLGEIRDLKEKECWYQIKVISEFPELEIAIHFEHDTTITIIIDDHTEVQYIKHVHQLQNLYFALTGEELTIKNE